MGSSNNNTNNMHYNFLQDADVWQGAPILTGSTKFEPHPDVKNIMITGGAGFM
jgi:dTDP-glucose 4,6-dehydratase